MPKLTVKRAEQVRDSVRGFAKTCGEDLLYIHIIFPSSHEVHRFSIEKSIIGHIESHDMTEVVLLNDRLCKDGSRLEGHR